MNGYILEFENLNHEISIHKMALLDTVLALINDYQPQIVLTLTSDLVRCTEGALKCIFEEKSDMNILNDGNISSDPRRCILYRTKEI